MPRHPDAVIVPNTLLSEARRRLDSPLRPGQCMSRPELADAVNAALDRLYPGRDLAAHYVDFRWVGKLERGEHRWPIDERRAALPGRRRCRHRQGDRSVQPTTHRRLATTDEERRRSRAGGALG
jgi:hypothetical protein